MPKLENPRHEEFARYLSLGHKQADAYVRAGYNENKGAASKMARSTAITERVEELRRDVTAKLQTAMALSPEDVSGTLAEMGFTLEWVAQQYKLIYDQATIAMAFPSAVASIQSIQKLIEAEKNATPPSAQTSEARLNISDMLSVLGKVGDILRIAKETPIPAPGDHARVVSKSGDE